MPPPYKPLDTKAILPRFRSVVYRDERPAADSRCYPIHDVKELRNSNDLPRFERASGSTHHIAARKHPAGTKRLQSGPLIFVGRTSDLTGFRYMTVA